MEVLEDFEYFMEDPEEEHLAFTYSWSDGMENPSGDYHHDLRISKDDPHHRTYTEWSNFDEIENGLSWEEYQIVEQKYLHLVLDFLDTFQVKQLTLESAGFTSIQKLGVPSKYFSPQEEALYQKLYEEDSNIEDRILESVSVHKEDFATFFQLVFKERISTWITSDSVDIQFGSQFYLYLSFNGHNQAIKKLVGQHGLFWQELSPPRAEAFDFT